jgi:ATPase subunit of ABC transporter with duplicated ATPase domains
MRILLAKLLLHNPDLLLLDEPTNHLDLEAVIALNTALQGYKGTLILVTHDEDLIDEVATRIWSIDDDGTLEDFQGPYSEFLAKHA